MKKTSTSINTNTINNNNRKKLISFDICNEVEGLQSRLNDYIKNKKLVIPNQNNNQSKILNYNSNIKSIKRNSTHYNSPLSNSIKLKNIITTKSFKGDASKSIESSKKINDNILIDIENPDSTAFNLKLNDLFLNSNQNKNSILKESVESIGDEYEINNIKLNMRKEKRLNTQLPMTRKHNEIELSINNEKMSINSLENTNNIISNRHKLNKSLKESLNNDIKIKNINFIQQKKQEITDNNNQIQTNYTYNTNNTNDTNINAKTAFKSNTSSLQKTFFSFPQKQHNNVGNKSNNYTNLALNNDSYYNINNLNNINNLGNKHSNNKNNNDNNFFCNNTLNSFYNIVPTNLKLKLTTPKDIVHKVDINYITNNKSHSRSHLNKSVNINSNSKLEKAVNLITNGFSFSNMSTHKKFMFDREVISNSSISNSKAIINSNNENRINSNRPSYLKYELKPIVYNNNNNNIPKQVILNTTYNINPLSIGNLGNITNIETFLGKDIDINLLKNSHIKNQSLLNTKEKGNLYSQHNQSYQSNQLYTNLSDNPNLPKNMRSYSVNNNSIEEDKRKHIYRGRKNNAYHSAHKNFSLFNINKLNIVNNRRNKTKQTNQVGNYISFNETCNNNVKYDKHKTKDKQKNKNKNKKYKHNKVNKTKDKEENKHNRDNKDNKDNKEKKSQSSDKTLNSKFSFIKNKIYEMDEDSCISSNKDSNFEDEEKNKIISIIPDQDAMNIRNYSSRENSKSNDSRNKSNSDTSSCRNDNSSDSISQSSSYSGCSIGTEYNKTTINNQINNVNKLKKDIEVIINSQEKTFLGKMKNINRINYMFYYNNEYLTKLLIELSIKGKDHVQNHFLTEIEKTLNRVNRDPNHNKTKSNNTNDKINSDLVNLLSSIKINLNRRKDNSLFYEENKKSSNKESMLKEHFLIPNFMKYIGLLEKVEAEYKKANYNRNDFNLNLEKIEWFNLSNESKQVTFFYDVLNIISYLMFVYAKESLNDKEVRDIKNKDAIGNKNNSKKTVISIIKEIAVAQQKHKELHSLFNKQTNYNSVYTTPLRFDIIEKMKENDCFNELLNSLLVDFLINFGKNSNKRVKFLILANSLIKLNNEEKLNLVLKQVILLTKDKTKLLEKIQTIYESSVEQENRIKELEKEKETLQQILSNFKQERINFNEEKAKLINEIEESKAVNKKIINGIKLELAKLSINSSGLDRLFSQFENNILNSNEKISKIVNNEKIVMKEANISSFKLNKTNNNDDTKDTTSTVKKRFQRLSTMNDNANNFNLKNKILNNLSVYSDKKSSGNLINLNERRNESKGVVDENNENKENKDTDSIDNIDEKVNYRRETTHSEKTYYKYLSYFSKVKEKLKFNRNNKINNKSSSLLILNPVTEDNNTTSEIKRDFQETKEEIQNIKPLQSSILPKSYLHNNNTNLTSNNPLNNVKSKRAFGSLSVFGNKFLNKIEEEIEDENNYYDVKQSKRTLSPKINTKDYKKLFPPGFSSPTLSPNNKNSNNIKTIQANQNGSKEPSQKTSDKSILDNFVNKNNVENNLTHYNVAATNLKSKINNSDYFKDIINKEDNSNNSNSNVYASIEDNITINSLLHKRSVRMKLGDKIDQNKNYLRKINKTNNNNTSNNSNNTSSNNFSNINPSTINNPNKQNSFINQIGQANFHDINSTKLFLNSLSNKNNDTSNTPIIPSSNINPEQLTNTELTNLYSNFNLYVNKGVVKSTKKNFSCQTDITMEFFANIKSENEFSFARKQNISNLILDIKSLSSDLNSLNDILVTNMNSTNVFEIKISKESVINNNLNVYSNNINNNDYFGCIGINTSGNSNNNNNNSNNNRNNINDRNNNNNATSMKSFNKLALKRSNTRNNFTMINNKSPSKLVTDDIDDLSMHNNNNNNNNNNSNNYLNKSVANNINTLTKNIKKQTTNNVNFSISINNNNVNKNFLRKETVASSALSVHSPYSQHQSTGNLPSLPNNNINYNNNNNNNSELLSQEITKIIDFNVKIKKIISEISSHTSPIVDYLNSFNENTDLMFFEFKQAYQFRSKLLLEKETQKEIFMNLLNLFYFALNDNFNYVNEELKYVSQQSFYINDIQELLGKIKDKNELIKEMRAALNLESLDTTNRMGSSNYNNYNNSMMSYRSSVKINNSNSTNPYINTITSIANLNTANKYSQRKSNATMNMGKNKININSNNTNMNTNSNITNNVSSKNNNSGFMVIDNKRSSAMNSNKILTKLNANDTVDIDRSNFSTTKNIIQVDLKNNISNAITKAVNKKPMNSNNSAYNSNNQSNSNITNLSSGLNSKLEKQDKNHKLSSNLNNINYEGNVNNDKNKIPTSEFSIFTTEISKLNNNNNTGTGNTGNNANQGLITNSKIALKKKLTNTKTKLNKQYSYVNKSSKIENMDNFDSIREIKETSNLNSINNSKNSSLLYNNENNNTNNFSLLSEESNNSINSSTNNNNNNVNSKKRTKVSFSKANIMSSLNTNIKSNNSNNNNNKSLAKKNSISNKKFQKSNSIFKNKKNNNNIEFKASSSSNLVKLEMNTNNNNNNNNATNNIHFNNKKLISLLEKEDYDKQKQLDKLNKNIDSNTKLIEIRNNNHISNSLTHVKLSFQVFYKIINQVFLEELDNQCFSNKDNLITKELSKFPSFKDVVFEYFIKIHEIDSLIKRDFADVSCLLSSFENKSSEISIFSDYLASSTVNVSEKTSFRVFLFKKLFTMWSKKNEKYNNTNTNINSNADASNIGENKSLSIRKNENKYKSIEELSIKEEASGVLNSNNTNNNANNNVNSNNNVNNIVKSLTEITDNNYSATITNNMTNNVNNTDKRRRSSKLINLKSKLRSNSNLNNLNTQHNNQLSLMSGSKSSTKTLLNPLCLMSDQKELLNLLLVEFPEIVLNAFYSNKLKTFSSQSSISKHYSLIDGLNIDKQRSNFSLQKTREQILIIQKYKTINIETLLNSNLDVNTVINEFPFDDFCFKTFTLFYQIIKNQQGLVTTKEDNKYYYLKYSIEEAVKTIIKKFSLSNISNKLKEFIEVLSRHQILNGKNIIVIEMDDVLLLLYHLVVYHRLMVERELNVAYKAIEVNDINSIQYEEFLLVCDLLVNNPSISLLHKLFLENSTYNEVSSINRNDNINIFNKLDNKATRNISSSLNIKENINNNNNNTYNNISNLREKENERDSNNENNIAAINNSILTRNGFIKLLLENDLFNREVMFKELKMNETEIQNDSESIISNLSTQLNNNMRTILDSVKVKISSLNSNSELNKLGTLLKNKLVVLKEMIHNYNNYRGGFESKTYSRKNSYYEIIRKTSKSKEHSKEKDVFSNNKDKDKVSDFSCLNTNSSLVLWTSLVLIDKNSHTFYMKSKVFEITDKINLFYKDISMMHNILQNNKHSSTKLKAIEREIKNKNISLNINSVTVNKVNKNNNKNNTNNDASKTTHKKNKSSNLNSDNSNNNSIINKNISTKNNNNNKLLNVPNANNTAINSGLNISNDKKENSNLNEDTSIKKVKNVKFRQKLNILNIKAKSKKVVNAMKNKSEFPSNSNNNVNNHSKSSKHFISSIHINNTDKKDKNKIYNSINSNKGSRKNSIASLASSLNSEGLIKDDLEKDFLGEYYEQLINNNN